MIKAFWPLSLVLCCGCGQTVDSNGLHVVDARVNVKLAVEDRLKNPSSASFPWAMDFKKIDEGTFETLSYVDATNSFGVTVRTHFAARASRTGILKSLELNTGEKFDRIKCTSAGEAEVSHLFSKDDLLTEFQRDNGVSNRIAEAAIKEWVITHGGNFHWDLEDVKRICLRNLRDGIPHHYLPESEKHK